MVPYLVTPPASMPVNIADMKAHLVVDFDDDDALIDAQQAAAVAHLDAHGGVLGRCIMPQTWAIDVTGPGPHLLPFPDASGVAADAGGDELSVETVRTARGVVVTVADASSGQDVTISATYGLPAERLSAAQMLIKLMVGNWYSNRTAATETKMSSLPMAADALIAALRWQAL